jgi:hypothetical protein
MEIIMDMSSIIAAQHIPANQFKFNKKALERSIMRADERRVRLHRIWAGIGLRVRSTVAFFDFATAMAPAKRQE